MSSCAALVGHDFSLIAPFLECGSPLPFFSKRVETNRRPALPFEAWREFERPVCARPFSQAAVACPSRSATPKV